MRTSAPPLPVAPLTWLFAIAGGLGLLSVVVPHDPVTDVPAVAVLSAVSLAVGGVVRLTAGRIGPRALAVLLGLSIGLISGAIVFTGGVPNASATLYTWVCLYAFYALSWRTASGLLALIALQYGLVIAIDPPDFPSAAHWTTTIGTLAGAGLLVGTLKGRLDRVIGHLADAANSDPLTGLLNRRGLRDAVDAELTRAGRTHRSPAVVLLDVDRFKGVNDRFGHTGGDEVLRDIAGVLRAQARAVDAVARTGGEEFALLLPETSVEQAAVIAERLRRTIPGAVSRPGLVLTASFGVAAHPTHGLDHDALLHAADRALYAAKRTGRDRVVVFDPETTAELLADGDVPARQESLVLLAESLDLRDASTAAHSQSVGRYAAAVAEQLGLPEPEVERVRLAGVLHDIGKLSMPDSVLLKPGGLDSDEWRLIRRHPEFGARLLEGAGLDDLAAWVRCHHERPDGAGYPLGLSGDAIPLEARVLAVADAYEAMTADRPYRPGRSHDEAVAELRRHAGRQFDPAVVEAFLSAIAKGSGVRGC